MANKINIVRACKNCGKPQHKNEKESTENWNAYDTNAVCECGGKFTFMSISDAEALKNNFNI